MLNFAWIKKTWGKQGKNASYRWETFQRFPISVSTAWCWHMALGWPLSARYNVQFRYLNMGPFCMVLSHRSLFCWNLYEIYSHQLSIVQLKLGSSSIRESILIHFRKCLTLTAWHVWYNNNIFFGAVKLTKTVLFVCLKTKTKEFVWHGQLRYKCFSFQT